MLFKVVWTDGYDREAIADSVVEENLSYMEAMAYCEALQAASDWDCDWWKVMPQNAHVWGGMEELV